MMLDAMFQNLELLVAMIGLQPESLPFAGKCCVLMASAHILTSYTCSLDIKHEEILNRNSSGAR
jgi:hypothetical protein